MDKIQMVDLKSQYLRLKIDIDAAIQHVIDNTAFINGSEVGSFAKELAEYNNCKFVLPCANGTDALQIAMMALELKPGDEVIVPAFTYVATVEVIALLGLKPVFIDVDPNTFNIDNSQLESVLTNKTKAIVPVHLFGQCADMEPLMEFAKAHNLKVIEDTAQAIGAEYTFSNKSSIKAGCIGDVGTTSFFPSKNLGCFGDGGAMFTNNEDLANNIRMIANHGQSRKYVHDSIGVNSRLDTLQAALLSVKLKQLDDFSNRRNIVAKKYDEAFNAVDALETPFRANNSTHAFHQYTLKVINGNRDELKSYLSDQNVPSMIYYPIPVHLQKAYSSYGYKHGDFPVTEKLCEQVLSLPIHTEMVAEQQDHIINSVLNYFG